MANMPQQVTKMPRVANVPPLPRTPAPPEYDDEVLRVAAKQIEAERKIAVLQIEVDELRRQLLDARSEMQRLETRLSHEQVEHEEHSKKERAGHDEVVGKLIEARDFWKTEAVRVKTLAQAGAQTFLQILDEREPRRQDAIADKAGLAAVADAIMQDALPHAVTAGPRDYPQKDEPSSGTS